MTPNQQSLNLSPFMAIYDIVVPKDNMLRQINDLVDFSLVHEELQNNYCLDHGRNASFLGSIMEMQGTMVIFAVNLKRILTLLK